MTADDDADAAFLGFSGLIGIEPGEALEMEGNASDAGWGTSPPLTISPLMRSRTSQPCGRARNPTADARCARTGTCLLEPGLASRSTWVLVRLPGQVVHAHEEDIPADAGDGADGRGRRFPPALTRPRYRSRWAAETFRPGVTRVLRWLT